MVKDLTHGNVMKLIISFSIPIFLGSLLQHLYNFIDTIIVGQFVGVDALAAVGVTGSLHFLIFGFVMGSCTGFSIPIAQNFGAENYVELRKNFANTIYVGMGLSLIVTAITYFAMPAMLNLMQTPADIYADTLAYARIAFLAIPITFLYNLLANTLRAMGDSKTPLYFLFIASGANLVLDLLFVIVLKWGVSGAAFATLLSQLVSAILCIIFVIKKVPLLHINHEERKYEKSYAISLLKIGIPMGLQFSITALGSVILQSAVNTLGSTIIAVVSIGAKINNFIMQPIQSLGQTMAIYTAQNKGAGNLDRIKEGIKKSFYIVLGFWILAFALSFFVTEPATLLLIKDDVQDIDFMIEKIQMFVTAACASYIFLGSLLVFRNTIQGLGYTTVAMGAGIFELVARVFIALVLVPLFAYNAVIFSDPLAWFSSNVLLIPAYIILFKKIQRNGG